MNKGDQNMKHEAKDITWNLDFLFKGIKDPRINENVESAIVKAAEVANDYKGRIKDLIASELLELLKTCEELYLLIFRPYVYSYLEYSTETTNEDKKLLKEKNDRKVVEFTNLQLY